MSLANMSLARLSRHSLLIALLALWPVSASAAPTDPKLEARFRKLARVASKKTVCVIGVVGSGTGAVIEGDGTTVTNAHVAAASPYAILMFADGRKVLAKRHGIDYRRDLAILRPVELPVAPLPHFELADKRPPAGTVIVGVGYPGGPRSTADPAFCVGVVTGDKGPANVNGMLDYGDAIRSDLPLFPGNSGGPCVDLQGRLVGINGAVDLQGSASFSVPIETVHDRRERLHAGLSLLPGNQQIDARRNPIVKLFRDQFDRLVLDMMKQRLNPKQGGDNPLLELLKGSQGSGDKRGRAPKPPAAGPVHVESDELALRARRSRRQALLRPLVAGALEAARSAVIPLLNEDGRILGFATAITRRHAVAPLDRVGDRRTFRSAELTLKLVAVDRSQGVALLVASKRLSPLEPGLDTAPGTIVATPAGPRGIAGVLSVRQRPVSAARAGAIANGGGLPAPIRDLLLRAKALAKRLGSKELAQLADQILNSTKAREQYMRGNRPRGYRGVLSHDAPLAPSEIGLPLVDRRGRLVGVNLSNAHFGTSYALGIKALARAFPQLGLRTRPAPRKGAKLY